MTAKLSVADNAALDLRDARATITALEAENARLRSAKSIVDLSDRYLENEALKAREALAKAKRDTWIAGRDASIKAAESVPLLIDIVWGGCHDQRPSRPADLIAAIRDLTPPVEAQGGSDA